MLNSIKTHGKFLTLFFGLALFIVNIALFHGFSSLLSVAVLAFCILTFYYAINIFIKNSVNTVFFLVLSIVALSFINTGYQLSLVFLLLILSFILLFNKRSELKDLISSDRELIQSIDFTDKLSWIFLFLIITVLGFLGNKAFFAIDSHHSIYELSIGRSYGISIFNTQDLSYNGHLLKFHFLSTRIPILFSHLFQVPLLKAAYLLSPLFYGLLFFILLNKFFSIFPTIKVPVIILFLFPLLGYSSIYISTLGAPGSYNLAFIVTLVALYHLVNKNFVSLIFSAGALILIKASFFLPLFGGIGLFLLRKKDYRHLFIIPPILFLIFIALYKIFLSGAHQHNLWLIGPSIVYSIIGSIKSLSAIYNLLLFAVLVGINAYIYFKENKNDILLALSSLSISGILWFSVVYEMTEGNSYQFMITAAFASIVILWYFVNRLIPKINSSLKIIFLYGFYVLTFFCLIYNIKPIGLNLIRYSIQEYAFVNRLYHVVKPGRKPVVMISKDLIDAYMWLDKNIDQNSIVLFGKHYEKKGIHDRWWPHTSFLRSALSGKQMYTENYKYKGICMEKDYPLRFANTIHFYKNYVIPGKTSVKILNLFYSADFGQAKSLPLSKTDAKYRNIKGKTLHKLSFGKEWCYLNIPPKINGEIEYYLNHFDISGKWALDFLNSADINYIVLEDNDQPTSFLKKVTTKVYENNSIMVLKYKI
ncbi:hypothetical protein ACFL57_03425 [Candidatus Margulisiibacteriota bacterium]